jgi:NAD(P)H-hydrate epimerase
MQQVDEETIARICPGIELMERAGRSVSEFVIHKYGGQGRKAVIFVGPGNNGGDGLVIARILAQSGWTCSAHLLKPADKFTPDARKNYQRFSKVLDENSAARTFDAFRPDWPARVAEDVSDADLLIDAIFGTGVSGAPRGKALEMIELINSSPLPVVSVDIPSGVNGSTGEAPGEAVVADDTVTIGAPKMGTLFHPGKSLAGEVTVVDIGFPAEIIRKYASDVHLLDRLEAASRLPARPPDIHKFKAGTLLLVAGSDRYRGAALLAGEGALRAGCGMVYLGVPAPIRSQIDAELVEAITFELPATAEGTVAAGAVQALAPYLERADAVAIGPGMGRNPETDGFVRDFLCACEKPVVIDADAISAFSGRSEALTRIPAPAIITPHSGELERLLGTDVPARPPERVVKTAQVADDLGVTLVHKGAPTLVASPREGLWINTTGNSALATGGTGDVLTGLVGGFLAQGARPAEAACVACFLHGRAGELAAQEMGVRGVIASDLFLYLGGAMIELEALNGDQPPILHTPDKAH